jgi:hypothetical protein
MSKNDNMAFKISSFMSKIYSIWNVIILRFFFTLIASVLIHF